VALMRHRITSVIIAVRRSYIGPEHAHMPPCVRLARLRITAGQTRFPWGLMSGVREVTRGTSRSPER
jgi:hypothetical protein